MHAMRTSSVAENVVWRALAWMTQTAVFCSNAWSAPDVPTQRRNATLLAELYAVRTLYFITRNVRVIGGKDGRLHCPT